MYKRVVYWVVVRYKPKDSEVLLSTYKQLNYVSVSTVSHLEIK
jgi:hypothetical protein